MTILQKSTPRTIRMKSFAAFVCVLLTSSASMAMNDEDLNHSNPGTFKNVSDEEVKGKVLKKKEIEKDLLEILNPRLTKELVNFSNKMNDLTTSQPSTSSSPATTQLPKEDLLLSSLPQNATLEQVNDQIQKTKQQLKTITEKTDTINSEIGELKAQTRKTMKEILETCTSGDAIATALNAFLKESSQNDDPQEVEESELRQMKEELNQLYTNQIDDMMLKVANLSALKESQQGNVPDDLTEKVENYELIVSKGGTPSLKKDIESVVSDNLKKMVEDFDLSASSGGTLSLKKVKQPQ